jgi:hypothetical protein
MTANSGTPDLSTVLPVPKKFDLVDQFAFAEYLQRARDHLLFYNWCDGILEEYTGALFDGIIGIFLFRFTPRLVGVDEWVWVVVGDLPPAYLTCDNCRNPSEALEGYLGEMMEWVEAAESGNSVAKLIPVNVPATPENASLLRTRLRFLQQRILPELRKSASSTD